MALLPPRVFGPLSECSRSVVFQFAILGATVVLLRTRAGNTRDVGKTKANLSVGLVSLFPGEELAGDDLVTAYSIHGHRREPLATRSDQGSKEQRSVQPEVLAL